MTTTNDHDDAIEALTSIGEDMAERCLPESDARRWLTTYSYGPSALCLVTDDEADDAIHAGFLRHEQAVLDEQERADLIDDEAIIALETSAGEAGDLEQVAVCQRALAGSDKDRAECARVIADARAMQDDAP